MLENFILGILAVVAVISDAYGDAKQDETKERLHFMEILPIITFIISGLLCYLFPAFLLVLPNYILFYILFRVTSFNFFYNIFRKGVDVFYIGKTSLYDKFLDKTFNLIIKLINYFGKKFKKDFELIEGNKIKYIKNLLSIILMMGSLGVGLVILLGVNFRY